MPVKTGWRKILREIKSVTNDLAAACSIGDAEDADSLIEAIEDELSKLKDLLEPDE